MAPETNFSELCRRFSISRKTGYKWLERYHSESASRLEERSHAAGHIPHRTPDAVVDAIVALRKAHPRFGPKKLRRLLSDAHPAVAWPALSTMGDVLVRHGLIVPRRRRVRIAPAGSPLPPYGAANDVWCIDFKGHFALGDGTRCYPLTLTDGASRYLLKCEGMAEPREFGVPRRMRSDNGPPFATLSPGGLSSLSVWWVKLGIVPERIEPGHPEQNGRHERMHRTLKAETAKPPAATPADPQRAFDRFRHAYNDLRPHEALGQDTPAKHFEPSSRAYPVVLSSPTYEDCSVRYVGDNGCVTFHGHKLSVGKLLAHEPVGFKQVGASRFEVFYGPISLGTVDERDTEMSLRPKRKTAGQGKTPDAACNPDTRFVQPLLPVTVDKQPGSCTPNTRFVSPLNPDSVTEQPGS